MPRVAVNGVQLAYEEAGAGSPLLLIHGFACGRRVWAPQIQALATRHRVIAYDVRGFGRSEAPRDPAQYSQPISVEDAHALLGALGAMPAAVCGLSMGGNIALNLALVHPEAVSALILCDTGVGSEDPAGFRARCEEFARAAEQRIEAFCESALAWQVFADYVAQGDAQRTLARQMILAHPAHGVALTARHTLGPRRPVYDLEPGLSALRIPTLVVYGERDVGCVESSRFLGKAIHGACIWEVPGATHFVNLDAPEAFNRRVLEFLGA